MEKNYLKFPAVPKKYIYEDYIAAHFQMGGWYVERSLIDKHGVEPVMELDIVCTDIKDSEIKRYLVEIKSGSNWGYSDIFKINGWMNFLGIDEGLFIAQIAERDVDQCKKVCNELKIKFIHDDDLGKTTETLNPYFIGDNDFNSINWIRYSYAVERVYIKRLKELKKNNRDSRSIKQLNDYYDIVNSGSFFTSDPLERLHILFKAYISNKNITAKLAKELTAGVYDEKCDEIPNDIYIATFWNGEDNPLQISLYVEHLARLAILKGCVDCLIKKSIEDIPDDPIDKFVKETTIAALPTNLINGLKKINDHKYCYKYPLFWQIFTYLLGGIILTDYKEQDYKILSKYSGIPLENIDEAFNFFSELFPKQNGWFDNRPYSNIKFHKMFPFSLSGIGLNFRRCEYCEIKEFENLKLGGKHTLKDIITWNKLSYLYAKDILSLPNQ